MKKLIAAFAVTLAATGQAWADNHFTGNLAYHNDLGMFAFRVADPFADIAIWTDSFADGVNFDPVLAVWKQNGSDWELIQHSDDDVIGAPGQTIYDAGLTFGLAGMFANLESGDYRLTLTTFNSFPSGVLLSNGFTLDGETPIPMGLWDQPANGVGKGTFYSVHLTGTAPI